VGALPTANQRLVLSHRIVPTDIRGSQKPGRFDYYYFSFWILYRLAELQQKHGRRDLASHDAFIISLTITTAECGGPTSKLLGAHHHRLLTWTSIFTFLLKTFHTLQSRKVYRIAFLGVGGHFGSFSNHLSLFTD